MLLDEQVSPRQYFPRLNERFDVKHIKHDLNLAGLPDPEVYELAVSQGRIILTKNVKDFRTLLRQDSPGIIGLPETWSLSRVDTDAFRWHRTHGYCCHRNGNRTLSGISIGAASTVDQRATPIVK